MVVSHLKLLKPIPDLSLLFFLDLGFNSVEETKHLSSTITPIDHHHSSDAPLLSASQSKLDPTHASLNPNPDHQVFLPLKPKNYSLICELRTACTVREPPKGDVKVKVFMALPRIKTMVQRGPRSGRA